MLIETTKLKDLYKKKKKKMLIQATKPKDLYKKMLIQATKLEGLCKKKTKTYKKNMLIQAERRKKSKFAR